MLPVPKVTEKPIEPQRPVQRQAPAVDSWFARAGGWRAFGAFVGVLVLGAGLTALSLTSRLKQDRRLMVKMPQEAAAEFIHEQLHRHVWWVISGSLATLVVAVGAWAFVVIRDRKQAGIVRYLKDLELLYHSGISAGSRLEHVRETMAEMADAARKAIGVDRSMVLVLNTEGTVFRVLAISGGFPAETPNLFQVTDTPACAGVAQTGRAMFVSDVTSPPCEINGSLALKHGARSLAVIPLASGGHVIGVMVLAHAQPRRFSAVDRRLAELLGAQTSMILANCRLYEKAQSAVAVYQDLMRQQQMVYEVAAAAYRAQSLEGSAGAIVQRAPGWLHVDGCTVYICEREGRCLRVLASSGEGADSIIGMVFASAASFAEPVLQNGKMLMIEDAQKTDMPPRDILRARKAGGVLVLPLKRSDGRALGVLSLMRHRAGAFAEEQARLAQVFADRAAEALENAMLQEQTRQDARTKTILLRELHHRVNNNLAGIVALLSMNQPPMSEAAHRWLRRNIERIEGMARAHDLFNRGEARVPLAELIGRVRESIAVLQDARVVLSIELDGGEIMLETPKAVSLAMVLHELCSNAMLHGVRNGGRVTIRGACMERRLFIQVCDDGVGFDVDEAQSRVAARRGGFGLHLVRELVGRELRGNLHVESEQGRGTTVSIAFSLDNDEENHP